jgi:hypothetical protein
VQTRGAYETLPREHDESTAAGDILRAEAVGLEEAGDILRTAAGDILRAEAVGLEEAGDILRAEAVGLEKGEDRFSQAWAFYDLLPGHVGIPSGGVSSGVPSIINIIH